VIFKSAIIQKTIDFLLPPQCALCHEITEKPYTLCVDCWGYLEFITSPKCSVCSVPLQNVDHDMPCMDCLKHPPIFTKAHAPLVYNDSLKKLILRFKNYDGLHLGPMFYNWLQRCIPENIDMIIPVPLHWWRFFMRQYNQATELGKILVKHTNMPMHANLLKRHKSTSSQGHKNKFLRYQNLADAFVVDDHFNILKNAKVLLIDDVLTSGATANACAQTLMNAGAKRVDVLTIARAVKEKAEKQDYGTP
jgi:ComF family protein